ncbi:hypothetical protein ES705_33465 [subsurface metagenome]
MTKGLGERSQIDSIPIDELVSKAYEFAECGRLQTFTSIFYGGSIIILDFDSILSYEVHYLKPDHYAVIIAPRTRQQAVDSCTMEGLANCQAWIFKYDGQHARWIIEAWNGSIGDKAFAQRARHLKSPPFWTDPAFQKIVSDEQRYRENARLKRMRKRNQTSLDTHHC